jgi:hypothetical protein
MERDRRPSRADAKEHIESLFQPDLILSAQYFENLRKKSLLEPEQRLMLAILEDGITCYRDNLHARGGRGKRVFDEAAAWITQVDVDWIFSFENVCDALGIKPEYVRRGLLDCNYAANRETPAKLAG